MQMQCGGTLPPTRASESHSELALTVNAQRTRYFERTFCHYNRCSFFISSLSFYLSCVYGFTSKLARSATPPIYGWTASCSSSEPSEDAATAPTSVPFRKKTISRATFVAFVTFTLPSSPSKQPAGS